MADTGSYFNPAAGANPLTAWAFAFRAAMARVRTATVVKVLAVTNDGGVSAVGSVDVQPLIQQTDSAGNVMALPVLYGLPYLRVQGGTNAIILDPQVGDLGIAVFADRDISTVSSTKKEGPPGSNRRNSLGDGMYLGGILNGVPEQYVQFNTTGITIVSPNKVEIDAGVNVVITTPSPGSVTVNSELIEFNGNLGVSGNVTVGNGASGQFTTPAGQTVTVQDGIVTNIF